MIVAPVVVVTAPSAATSVAALESADIRTWSLPAKQALLAIQAGRAKVLVSELIVGWRALFDSVHQAGGVAVLCCENDEQCKAVRELALPAEAVVTDDLAATIQWVIGRLTEPDRPVEYRDPEEHALDVERVNAFAQRIARQIDLPHVIREAIARTQDLCGACGASLLLVDADTGELYFDTVVGRAADQIERIRLQPGVGIAGRVARTAQPMRVDEAQGNELLARECDQRSGFQTGSVIAVPLVTGGDLLGVLEAVRAVGKPSFKQADLRRLLDLAPHVTIAVHNAQINAQLRESQTQVLRANQDLEEKVRERTQQIQRGKREWEQTFDAISEPISLQDGFVLRRVNQAYAVRAGLPIQAVPGRTCHQVLAGRETPCVHCPLLVPDGPLSSEVDLKSGRFKFSGFHLSPGSDNPALVVHYRDVTEERALAARLRESERLATVGQLASGAAHEINNPMAFMVANLNTLDSTLSELEGLIPNLGTEVAELLEDSRAMIAETQQGARRVTAIVRALRELSRLEVSRSEPASVNASVSRVLRTELGTAIDLADLRLDAEGMADIPPLHLDHALTQIVRNARQAGQPSQHIRIRTWTDDGIHISIEDDGAGIAPENLNRIFEPFFTTRGIGQGIGLGLTAAYGVVTRHGGTIEVRSDVGRGSVFTLHLLRAAIPVAAAA